MRAVRPGPPPPPSRASMPSAAAIERVNALNLGLMLLAAVVAWVAPFELFLAAYAVLGPLHYLTQISWLHDRGYFTPARTDVLPLVALGAIDAAARFTGRVPWTGPVVLAFALAIVLVVARTRAQRIVLAGAALVATLALERWGSVWALLIVFLPTVIHVFVFTGLFILQGSVRSRSPTGFASLVVFVTCGAFLLGYRPAAGHYAVDPRTPPLVEQFGPVIDQLLGLTGGGSGWDSLVGVGRFLAYAYTYHYLNWFSKTRVIRWHAVAPGRKVAIGLAWAAAVGLYAIDFRVGLVVLLWLSVLHVLLEFPLDVRTIGALAGSAGRVFGGAGRVP